MLFRPLNAVLVAAYIYLGGLGAASAPMNFGNELSPAIPKLVRSPSNNANDGGWAYGGGLQHSHTLYPTQMLHRENFGTQMPDPQDASHQDSGNWNADYVGSFLDPNAAQHHDSGYGSMQVDPLHTYGTAGYGQHSGLSIESAPSLHQHQVPFGDPGIPSLSANQHDQAHTDFHGNVLDVQHAGVPRFPDWLRTGRIEAKPLHLPQHYGNIQDVPIYEGVPVSRMSQMGVDGQNPGYQGMGHQSAARAGTAYKTAPGGVGNKMIMANEDLKEKVLSRLHEMLKAKYSNGRQLDSEQSHTKQVKWVDQVGVDGRYPRRKRSMDWLYAKLKGEEKDWQNKPASTDWDGLMSKNKGRMDLGKLRIVLKKDKLAGPMDAIHLFGFVKGTQQRIYVGLLQVPSQLELPILHP
ncbi:hypothetical protein ACQY0O_005615 [Thecaphora frezii]